MRMGLEVTLYKLHYSWSGVSHRSSYTHASFNSHGWNRRLVFFLLFCCDFYTSSWALYKFIPANKMTHTVIDLLYHKQRKTCTKKPTTCPVTTISRSSSSIHNAHFLFHHIFSCCFSFFYLNFFFTLHLIFFMLCRAESALRLILCS